MKIMITGANGQLGQEFIRQVGKKHTIYPYSRQELDITSKHMVYQLVKKVNPDIILHCAAFTKVDQCEDEIVKAFEVNSVGTFNVAKVAREISADLVYFSSDYVFDGKKQTPYTEEDNPNPLSIYGKTKFLGEEFVKAIHPKSYIVRTSWVYGQNGNNFVNTMLSFAEQGKTVKVVNDQVGSPTSTYDLAEKVLQLLGKPYGIYHIANQGKCSWYEFAREIFKVTGYDPDKVIPISSIEYGASAIRPSFSVLGQEALDRQGLEKTKNWKAALSEFLRRRNND